MQQETRIKNLFYALFGATFLILLVLIGGYFLPPSFGYRKLQTDIQAQETRISSNTSKANGLGTAQVDYVKAQINKEAAEAQLAYMRYRYFGLDINKIDDNYSLYNAFDNWLAIYRGGNPARNKEGYGPQLQQELDNAVRLAGVSYAAATTGAGAGGGAGLGTSSASLGGRGGGVGGATSEGGTTRPSIAIPQELAPKNPEDVPGLLPANGLLTPVARIDGMAVRGDLGSILRFFQIITSSRSTILKTVSGVRLEGSSPDIVATFSLSPYLVARGKAVPITATYGGGTGAVAGATGATPGAAGPGLSTVSPGSSAGGNGVTSGAGNGVGR